MGIGSWSGGIGRFSLPFYYAAFHIDKKGGEEKDEILALDKELEDESDIDLTDEEGSKAKDPSPRKTSLSPTQFLQSRATRPLNRSMAKHRELSCFFHPCSGLRGKRKGSFIRRPE